MRKYIFLLVSVFALTLLACDGNEPGTQGSDNNAKLESVITVKVSEYNDGTIWAETCDPDIRLDVRVGDKLVVSEVYKYINLYKDHKFEVGEWISTTAPITASLSYIDATTQEEVLFVNSVFESLKDNEYPEMLVDNPKGKMEIKLNFSYRR